MGVTRGHGLLENFLSFKRMKMVDKLIPNLSRKGKILDIGCGNFPFFLTKIKFKHKYGADKLINYNHLKHKGIKLINLDIEKINKFPFRDNTFDIITMLAVFEHINKDKLNFILKEIIRILKKEGNFILTTPTPLAKNFLYVMSKLSLVSKEEIEEHKKLYNKNEIINLLKNAGFKENKIRYGYFEIFLNSWACTKK